MEYFVGIRRTKQITSISQMNIIERILQKPWMAGK